MCLEACNMLVMVRGPRSSYVAPQWLRSGSAVTPQWLRSESAVAPQ